MKGLIVLFSFYYEPILATATKSRSCIAKTFCAFATTTDFGKP